jgi:hypothetical protein
MTRIAELARETLGRRTWDGSLEALWRRCALASLADGRLVEPATADARRFTMPERAWSDVAPWPREYEWDRMAALRMAQYLAMVRSDRIWLTELFACWASAPEGDQDLNGLRAQGEIGLALAPDGPRPGGWTGEELSCLEEEGYLSRDAAVDRAWRAIREDDLATAGGALAAYESVLAGLAQAWVDAPEEGLRYVLTHPDSVLQLERRALRALLAARLGA